MTAPADNPEVVVRPPLLYGTAFIAVLVLRWFWPMPILSHAMTPLLGLGLLLLGLAVVVLGRRALQTAGTNVNPSRPNHRDRRIRSVSLLSQSPVCGDEWGFVLLVPILSSCIAEWACVRSATSNRSLARRIGSIVPGLERISEQERVVNNRMEPTGRRFRSRNCSWIIAET